MLEENQVVGAITDLAYLVAISEAQYNEIVASTDPAVILSRIIEFNCINIPSADTNKRGRVVIESFFHLLLFIKGLEFSYIKASKCTSIINNLFCYIAFDDETLATKEGCAEIIKSQLLSVLTSPPDRHLFSADEIKQIADYFARNILQNFLLYHYLLHESPNEEIREARDLVVQTPMISLALANAEEIIVNADGNDQ